MKMEIKNKNTGETIISSETMELKALVEKAVGEGADLSEADLRRADLRFANLSGADLSHADLRDANLSGANLSGANLSGADLSEADLLGADLRGADLRYGDLLDADLSGADLSGAKLNWQSRELISEVLWQTATNVEQKMLASYIGRERDKCWPYFMKQEHSEKEWALRTLATYVQEGDDIPAPFRKWINGNMK